MKSLRSETLLPCWPLLCSAQLSNLARKLEWGAGQGSSASPVSSLPPSSLVVLVSGREGSWECVAVPSWLGAWPSGQHACGIQSPSPNARSWGPGCPGMAVEEGSTFGLSLG